MNETTSPFTIASDEDMTVGYLLDQEGLPTDHDALLGLFIVLAAREWGEVFHPRKLTLRPRPRPYRFDEAREELVPTIPRLADSRWWIIDGLEEATR